MKLYTVLIVLVVRVMACKVDPVIRYSNETAPTATMGWEIK